MTLEQEQIATIRDFNRFYTARLGLLRKHHLDGEFSLTEARILFETNLNPNLTAREITEMFYLDPGYVSRTLASLTKQGLITQTKSARDGREKQLSLTQQGREKVAEIDMRSAQEMDALLANISAKDRATLVDSFTTIRRILSPSQVEIRRIKTVNQDAMDLIEEYYEAINVVVRDTPVQLQRTIEEPHAGLWVAYLDGEPVGCVALRPIPVTPNAVECKRLYVRPSARGRRVAEKLLDEMEAFAIAERQESIYLDTHDGLQAAIHLYRKRGYVDCERYNDNPQATVFMRKDLRAKEA